MPQKYFFSKSWTFYQSLDNLKKHDRFAKTLDGHPNHDVQYLLHIKKLLRKKVKKLYFRELMLFMFLAIIIILFAALEFNWGVIISLSFAFALLLVALRIVVKILIGRLEREWKAKHGERLTRIFNKTSNFDNEYSAYWYYRLTILRFKTPKNHRKLYEPLENWEESKKPIEFSHFDKYARFHEVFDQWEDWLCADEQLLLHSLDTRISSFHVLGFVYPKLWTKLPIEFGIDAVLYILLNPDDAPNPRQRRLEKNVKYKARNNRRTD